MGRSRPPIGGDTSPGGVPGTAKSGPVQTDELAARRALKATLTISIGGRERKLPIPAAFTPDPAATLRARAPRKPRRRRTENTE